MKTTMQFKVPSGKILSTKVLESNICELEVELEDTTKNDCLDNFLVRIEASKLSLTDKFMQHEPKNEEEEELKQLLTKVIKRGIKDFWRPRFDPSFNDEGSGICYKPGSKPAVGKSYNWWKDIAKNFDTKRRSRLGTKSQYVAFLGVLIKALVDEGWKVKDAWHAVCRDSRNLGHYWDSKNAKRKFEPTGSRNICGFFDLVNTCKILAEDEDEKAGGFWIAGGNYCSGSSRYPLSDLYHDGSCCVERTNSVGWVIFEECPDC